MGKKSKAILLNSDFTGEEMDVSVEGGFCKIDWDKENRYEFFLDKSRPIKVKFTSSPFKSETKDFYLLSWKSIAPVEFREKKEFIRKENINETLKKDGMTEEDIENINKEIERVESEEGKEITKFVYRQLVPVEIEKKHWAKTELPAILRETTEMRFLKALKAYTEGGGTGKSISGKWIALIMGIVFFGVIMIYSFSYALG